jgi:hypothetical protein
MIYEYRCYEITPGKAADLHDRFAQHTIGLMRRHGFRIQGIWEPVFGQANQLNYLLKWADPAEREDRFQAFESDPAFGSRRDAGAHRPPVQRAVAPHRLLAADPGALARRGRRLR